MTHLIEYSIDLLAYIESRAVGEEEDSKGEDSEAESDAC
jgi:hypothetical protein